MLFRPQVAELTAKFTSVFLYEDEVGTPIFSAGRCYVVGRGLDRRRDC